MVLGLVLWLAPAWQELGVAPLFPPPETVWPAQTFIGPAAGAARGLRAHVGVWTDRGVVEFEWIFEDESGETIFTRPQKYVAGFWPTAAVNLGKRGDTLLVGGLSATDGSTVIEKWTLRFPALPQRVPGAVETVYEARVVRELVHREDVEGRYGIRFMEPVRGKDLVTHVLVHFTDSGDLYVMSVSDGSLELLLAADLEPELARPYWIGISSGLHPTQGFVYHYGTDPCGGPHGTYLVLLDKDKDGRIDWHQLLDNAGWTALLGNPHHWTAVFD